ncbi:MAG: hypothetical protein NHB32_16355 [Fischerella sp. CENA71]|nr:hypothetical protein [Fischerella sp. CENA71]
MPVLSSAMGYAPPKERKRKAQATPTRSLSAGLTAMLPEGAAQRAIAFSHSI